MIYISGYHGGLTEKIDNWIVYINNQGYNPIVHI